MNALLEAWIGFQRSKPVLFFALLGLIVFLSATEAFRSEIEAFPELTSVQVQVITQYPGKAAEEVERQLTVPLEVATTGLPGLINQRSLSIFGLSVITLTFDDAVKSRQARLDVSQRLSDADLPDGVKPTLSPDSTPVGEIFRYTLAGNRPVDELRLYEDWTLEREFKSIPGVADVVSFGGPTRTIEVRLEPQRLSALGLSASSVAQALGQNHANAGGSLITHGAESFVIRSLGLYENAENLEMAVIATQHGVPIRVRDVGRVQLSHKPRLGQVGRNEEDDAVEGIILLRQGSDTLRTCAEIHKRIQHLNASVLPAGVRIVPYYDRTDLIERSSHTVFHNIAFGVLLVCGLLTIGLGTGAWPMVLAVALIIPFALLLAFLGIQLLGYSPNLISLGAVDFGIIVETAIFAAEAVIVARAAKKDERSVVEALSAVLLPAFLCAFLLLLAFIPILSLQRVEGRIFRPLGITLISALVGGQLGAFIFVPLAIPFCKAEKQHHDRFHSYFERIIDTCEHWGRRLSAVPHLAVRSIGALAVLLAMLIWITGREFLPALNEGALWVRALVPPTISRQGAVDFASKVRFALKSIPEVHDVVSQIGRPDDGTDTNGFDDVEFYVALSPPGEWKTASSIDGFIVQASKRLESMPGVDFSFSQPIKDNVDEAISGVKGELVVKIYGQKIDLLQKSAEDIARVIKAVPGAEDVAAEQLMGQPEFRFNMNRERLARYGLRVTDAEDVLETALSGKFAAKMTDDQGRLIDIVVKPDLPVSPEPSLLASLPVITPDGAKVPLSEISNSGLVEGVSRIYRETGERRIAVKCSVRDRAMIDFVRDADARIKKSVTLPSNFRYAWSGTFENAQRASQQLLFLVPLCVLAMVIVLYSWFGLWWPVGLLLLEIPFSAIGGFTALGLFGLNFSISAAAGGVVLIGVSFLTGIMLLSEYFRLKDPWEALSSKGKSILLSSGVAIIGLAPAALSNGIGSETAKPFAVMILGGLTSSLVLSLTLLPALLAPKQERMVS